MANINTLRRRKSARHARAQNRQSTYASRMSEAHKKIEGDTAELGGIVEELAGEKGKDPKYVKYAKERSADLRARIASLRKQMATRAGRRLMATRPALTW